MQGKTHLVVGTALALVLLPPVGLQGLILGTGLAALGSVISDIDSGHSGAGQDAARVMALSAIIVILTVAADLTFHAGILNGIAQRMRMNSSLAAGIVFVVILLSGILLPHRSFMHSITGGALLCACLYQLMPRDWAYFAVGFGSHLLLDVTNQRGEQLFFPLRKRYALRWFKSNGFVNRLLLAAGGAALAIVLYHYAAPYIRETAQGVGQVAQGAGQVLQGAGKMASEAAQRAGEAAQKAARGAGESLRSGMDQLAGK